tara:strand:- start:267 stop:686 length:420 start_codon:yes stop_codon:yes gene_type:complete
MKQCTKCSQLKELTEFTFRVDTGNYRNSCRACKLTQQQLSDSLKHVELKLYHRNRHLQKTYGLSLEGYAKMLEEQGGRCAICAMEEKHAPHGVLSVDHCHESGVVRALLCNPCNTGIGQFKENQDFLANAIDYLKRFNT